MNKKLRIGLIVVGSIILFIALSFGGLYYFKFFGPQYENVKREIFEQTKSYNEGKEQDLLRYRLEYLKTDDPVEREAIASTIRMQFADYNEDLLNETLRSFLINIKYGGE